MACSIAAVASRGGSWTDGTHCETGDVLIASGEDDPGDTLRPRLEAAGADLRRIHFLDGKRDGKGKVKPWCLGDFEALDRHLSEHPSTRALIIDPISSFMPNAIDSHKNTEVRGALAPLCRLLAERRVAGIAVTHLRKGDGEALYRAIGSLAFVAAARAAWVVARDRENEERRLFLPLKSNLAAKASGLAFSVRAAPIGEGATDAPTPRVAWESGAVEMTADQALAPVDRSADAPARGEAEAMLRELLKDGPVPQSPAAEEARERCISWRTVMTAKSRLRVRSRTLGFRGKSWWELPPEEQPRPKDATSLQYQNVCTDCTDNQALEASKSAIHANDASISEVGGVASIGKPEAPHPYRVRLP